MTEIVSHIDSGFQRTAEPQTQLERSRRVPSTEELIYATGRALLQPQRGRRGCKSNSSAEEKNPAAMSTPIGNTQELWPNEFMAAELILVAQ